MKISRRSALGMLAAAPAIHRAAAQTANLRYPQRKVRGNARIAEGVPSPGVVSRREIRHLGALGSAIGAGAGRLVRAQHVHRGQRAVQVSLRDLRAPFEVRIQGRRFRRGRAKVRRRASDRDVQEGRREILRQHGGATTTTSICGTPSTIAGTPPRWGRRKILWVCSTRRRTKRRAEIRRQRASLDQLQMVRHSHGSDKTGPYDRRALRWHDPEIFRSLSRC